MCRRRGKLESARYVVHLAVEAGEVFSEVQKRRFDVIVVGVQSC
ncbi:MAG: hypothetical protein U0231_13970 [Nitrospiraceae bacterium]